MYRRQRLAESFSAAGNKRSKAQRQTGGLISQAIPICLCVLSAFLYIHDFLRAGTLLSAQKAAGLTGKKMLCNPAGYSATGMRTRMFGLSTM